MRVARLLKSPSVLRHARSASLESAHVIPSPLTTPVAPSVMSCAGFSEGLTAAPPPVGYDPTGPPTRRRPRQRPPHRRATGPRSRSASSLGQDCKRSRHFDPTHLSSPLRNCARASWRGSLGESAGSYPVERVWVPNPQSKQPRGPQPDAGRDSGRPIAARRGPGCVRLRPWGETANDRITSIQHPQFTTT